jgi:hypothetical protein
VRGSERDRKLVIFSQCGAIDLPTCRRTSERKRGPGRTKRAGCAGRQG